MKNFIFINNILRISNLVFSSRFHLLKYIIYFSPFYLVRATEIVAAVDSEGISLPTILRINPLAL